MRSSQSVPTSIWGLPRFLRLDPEARLMVLYLWTAPDSGPAGLVRLDGNAKDVVGLSPGAMSLALENAQSSGVVVFDLPYAMVLPKWSYEPQSVALSTAAIREVSACPSGEIRAAFFREYPELEDRLSTQGGGQPDSRTAALSVVSELRLFRADKRLVLRWPDLVDRWSDLYPGIGIVRCAREAHAWLEDNPKRQKKDLARFLHNWMRRDAEKYRATALVRQPEKGIDEFKREQDRFQF